MGYLIGLVGRIDRSTGCWGWWVGEAVGRERSIFCLDKQETSAGVKDINMHGRTGCRESISRVQGGGVGGDLSRVHSTLQRVLFFL